MRLTIRLILLAAMLMGTMATEARLRVARRAPVSISVIDSITRPDPSIIKERFSRPDTTSTIITDLQPDATLPEAVDTAVAVAEPTVVDSLELLPIMGMPEIDPKVMAAFVQMKNPDFDPEIARAFHNVGIRYGIRGDIALCQSILETGWFMFVGGTAVTPDQHNYCGLGVVSRGVKGHSFPTIELGVTAQIQHLYAYATKAPLPAKEEIIDPRFKLVGRGIAPTWRDLNRRWAMNDHYSTSIMGLYKKLMDFKAEMELGR